MSHRFDFSGIRHSRYYPGSPGWVVADVEVELPGGPRLFWWYGHRHSWGNTWGGTLDGMVATYPTRREAEEAFRSVQPLRRRYRPMKVAEAERRMRAQASA